MALGRLTLSAQMGLSSLSYQLRGARIKNGEFIGSRVGTILASRLGTSETGQLTGQQLGALSKGRVVLVFPCVSSLDSLRRMHLGVLTAAKDAQMFGFETYCVLQGLRDKNDSQELSYLRFLEDPRFALKDSLGIPPTHAVVVLNEGRVTFLSVGEENVARCMRIALNQWDPTQSL